MKRVGELRLFAISQYGLHKRPKPERHNMNPRERILAAIHHEHVDCFPTDIWATPEVWEKLFQYFSTIDRIDVYNQLGIDGIISIAPTYIGPELAIIDGIRYNEWGMGFRMQDYGTGIYDEQVVYPLAEAETIGDLDAYTWPSVDWYDFSSIPEAISQYPDRAIEVGYTACFYYHNLLRGLALSMMDPLEKPEFSKYLLDRISDFFTDYHRCCFEAGRGLIDITQVTDDFGAQTGLLINPRVFDQFYRQPIHRAIGLARSYDITVFHHDDGDCRPLLPRLIDMGIQVLNPVQWRCGNWDLAGLKQQYGDRLCFHGGVDNQQTLPFGTEKDVRTEVRRLAQTIGSDRTGWIIAPCHNLQSITPLENILAMYDEAHNV
jgi:uroporphyrinogen decarboxylase